MPRKRRFKPTRKPSLPIENGGPEMAISSGRLASNARQEELEAHTGQSHDNDKLPTPSSYGRQR
jgi:hypothetical protein